MLINHCWWVDAIKDRFYLLTHCWVVFLPPAPPHTHTIFPPPNKTSQMNKFPVPHLSLPICLQLVTKVTFLFWALTVVAALPDWTRAVERSCLKILSGILRHNICSGYCKGQAADADGSKPLTPYDKSVLSST